MDREEEDGAGAEEGSGERLCFEAGVGLRAVRVSELEEDRGEASRVWRKEGDGKARVLVSGERRTGKCNRGWWGGGEGGGIAGGVRLLSALNDSSESNRYNGQSQSVSRDHGTFRALAWRTQRTDHRETTKDTHSDLFFSFPCVGYMFSLQPAGGANGSSPCPGRSATVAL